MTPRHIQALRLKLGLTRAQFAALLGTTYTTIYRYETGRMGLHKSVDKQLRELGRKT